MSTFRLLLAELLYRKTHFALSVLAVVVAVMLFVAAPVLVDGYRQQTQDEISVWQARVMELEDQVTQMRQGMGKFEADMAAELGRMERETRRLMRDLGFNLMIVHRDAKLSDFWAADYAAKDMPQEYVERLARDPRLTLVTHLVATLQEKITWENRKVLLVGYLPETAQAHSGEKSPMGYNIRPQTALLGHELGVGRKAGEMIRIKDEEFRIARVMPEQGSKEDITIALHLSDAQKMLGRPGVVNQIMALGCRCSGTDLPNIRKQLADVLPETQITEFHTLAVARAEQRTLVEANKLALLAEMKNNLKEREKILGERRQVLADLEASRMKIQRTVETLAELVTPLAVLVSAVWVGLLALANVRQRRTEIGLLRALGKSSGTIASLFLGKAILVGFAGALLGTLLGAGLAMWLGVHALEISAEALVVRLDLATYALLGAPLLSAAASYLPTLAALVQDPAVALRET